MRRIEMAAVRENSKQKALRRTKEALERIPRSERAQGAKRVIRTETDEAAKGVGKQLSSNGKVRGPEGGKSYLEHYNPAEGPYSDVHIETAAKTALTVGGVIAIIGEVASPAQSAVIESGDPTPGELASSCPRTGQFSRVSCRVVRRWGRGGRPGRLAGSVALLRAPGSWVEVERCHPRGAARAVVRVELA
jgi:hypothetical protein